jgi:hypothetical protein
MRTGHKIRTVRRGNFGTFGTLLVEFLSYLAKFKTRAGNSRLETYTQNNPMEYYRIFGLLWIIVDYFVDYRGFFVGLLDYFGLLRI